MLPVIFPSHLFPLLFIVFPYFNLLKYVGSPISLIEWRGTRFFQRRVIWFNFLKKKKVWYNNRQVSVELCGKAWGWNGHTASETKPWDNTEGQVCFLCLWVTSQEAQSWRACCRKGPQCPPKTWNTWCQHQRRLWFGYSVSIQKSSYCVFLKLRLY